NELRDICALLVDHGIVSNTQYSLGLYIMLCCDLRRINNYLAEKFMLYCGSFDKTYVCSFIQTKEFNDRFLSMLKITGKQKYRLNYAYNPDYNINTRIQDLMINPVLRSLYKTYLMSLAKLKDGNTLEFHILYLTSKNLTAHEL